MDNMFDIHNHILPGVDDGSSCIEETTLLIDSEYEQGVRNIIFTPHFRPGMFGISTEDRLEVFREVCEVVKDKYPDLKLYLGCEVYLNEKSIEFISKPSNRMLGQNVVLVEFNYGISFSKMLRLIKHVQNQGFKIVIAHIERYNCLRERMNNIENLKHMGCYLQVNCDAVIGKDGFMTKRFIDKLFKASLVDFVASDAHDIKRRKVNIYKSYKRVSKKYGEEVAQAVLGKNAEVLFMVKGE